MKVLFVGGPGNISESTISYLLGRDAQVAVLKRSPGGLLGFDGRITVFHGDRDREDILVDAFTAFRPDIVIDCTCFGTEQASALVRALRRRPCRRVLFISTADVYGYPLLRLPMREDDPWGQPSGDYARDKLAVEQLYAEAFSDGEPRLTIIRPGYSLGKTFAMTAFGIHRGTHLVTRIRQGRPICSPGDGTTLIDAGAAHNTGRMIARICEDDATAGQAYNCAHPHAVTYDEYLQAFAEAVGRPARIVHVPTDFMLSVGRDEVSSLGDMTRFHLYFSVDKFRAQFPDFEWEYSLADAARDFIHHQELVGGFAGSEESQFEDVVADLWPEGMAALKKRIVAILDQNRRAEFTG